MPSSSLEHFLQAATVDPAIFELRPDYRVLLMAIDGINPGPSDGASEALLLAAEESAGQALAAHPVQDLPHVAAWREAYRAFGSKPQRTRNSLEALLRRADAGLPRVNRLTDVYNAISVLHRLPLGGEDVDRYQGAPRLLRATGEETFDTTAGGEDVVEQPEPGEVVWRDDVGVTCRRWNWRQGRRTGLTDTSTRALFILDALDPTPDGTLHTAADELVAHLAGPGSDVTVARRMIVAS